MFVIIKKSHAESEWLIGLCGSPSEIISQFLASGVKELYQRVWLQNCGDVGEATFILNDLMSRAKQNAICRSDIETLNITITDWTYSCFGCAETADEAKSLCARVREINASAPSALPPREKAYRALIETLENSFPDNISKNELHQLAIRAMNLKL